MVRAGKGVLLGTGPRKTRVNKGKSASYEATALLLPRSLLSDLDLNLDGPEFGKMLDQMSVELAPASDAIQRLDGCIWYTARQLVSDDAVPLSVTVAESAEQLLLNLFSEAISEILEYGQLGTTSVDMKKVREAEEFMRVKLHQNIQLADISKAVGVSARSLQIAFQKSRGISPTTSLQRIRLEEIHRRLTDKTNDKSVTEIAHECGWTHLGRLSAAFKQRFGRVPSVIRREARLN
jgi:AraC-like DNA-binding protein